jgi:hypothetical protein
VALERAIVKLDSTRRRRNASNRWKYKKYNKKDEILK